MELSRDLKQSTEQRDEDNKRQADNQRRNARMRADVAGVLCISPERVRAAENQKVYCLGTAELRPDRSPLPILRCAYQCTHIAV